jgi:hypothetical protein
MFGFGKMEYIDLVIGANVVENIKFKLMSLVLMMENGLTSYEKRSTSL